MKAYRSEESFRDPTTDPLHTPKTPHQIQKCNAIRVPPLNYASQRFISVKRELSLEIRFPPLSPTKHFRILRMLEMFWYRSVIKDILTKEL